MQLVHGPHLEEDTGVFLSRIYFPVPSLSLTNWPTEQSELPGVEIETLKSRGEWASAWTSNRLSPCASPFIREIASQHHALTSYWTKLGHRVIVKPQGRLEKTVSGVLSWEQILPLKRRGKRIAAGLHPNEMCSVCSNAHSGIQASLKDSPS